MEKKFIGNAKKVPQYDLLNGQISINQICTHLKNAGFESEASEIYKAFLSVAKKVPFMRLNVSKSDNKNYISLKINISGMRNGKEWATHTIQLNEYVAKKRQTNYVSDDNHNDDLLF